MLSYRYFALGVGFGRPALRGGFSLGVSFVRVSRRRFRGRNVRVRNLVFGFRRKAQNAAAINRAHTK